MKYWRQPVVSGPSGLSEASPGPPRPRWLAAPQQQAALKVNERACGWTQGCQNNRKERRCSGGRGEA